LHTGDDLTTQNSKRAGKKPSQPAAVRGADSGVNPEFVQRIDWLPNPVAGLTTSDGVRITSRLRPEAKRLDVLRTDCRQVVAVPTTPVFLFEEGGASDPA